MDLISGKNAKLKKMCQEVDIKKGIKLGNRLQRFFNSKVHNALGLAAPQVGLVYRVFVMRFEGINTIVINPTIKEYGRQKEKMEEGCLSHFSTMTKNGKIRMKRSIEIDVIYWNGKGEKIEETLNDMPARIFQHEIDHLNGKCIVDK